MGVEAGNRQPWSRDAELVAQPGMGDLDHTPQTRGGQLQRHLIQRDMDGCRDHAQLIRGKHHYHVTDAPERCKVFGVAGVGKIGTLLERLFMDRRRAERRSCAITHQRHAECDHIDDVLCVGRVPAGPVSPGCRNLLREPAGDRGQALRPRGDPQWRDMVYQREDGWGHPARPAELLPSPHARRRGNLGANACRLPTGNHHRQGLGHRRVIRALARNSFIRTSA